MTVDTNEYPVTVHRGPWTAVWRGGRLMDIYHAECEGAVECIQPSGGWDGRIDKWCAIPDAEDVQAKLDAWVIEHGGETVVNVVLYR